MKRPGLHVYPQRGGKRFVTPRFEEVLIVDQEGKTVREITRKADGRWIDGARKASVAPDGSFAVMGSNSVDLFEASGDPIGTIELPRSLGYAAKCDYDGTRLVALGSGKLVLFERTGGAGTMLNLPDLKWDERKNWEVFLAAEGKEVWVFDGEWTILRFGLP